MENNNNNKTIILRSLEREDEKMLDVYEQPNALQAIHQIIKNESENPSRPFMYVAYSGPKTENDMEVFQVSTKLMAVRSVNDRVQLHHTEITPQLNAAFIAAHCIEDNVTEFTDDFNGIEYAGISFDSEEEAIERYNEIYDKYENDPQYW